MILAKPNGSDLSNECDMTPFSNHLAEHTGNPDPCPFVDGKAVQLNVVVMPVAHDIRSAVATVAGVGGEPLAFKKK